MEQRTAMRWVAVLLVACVLGLGSIWVLTPSSGTLQDPDAAPGDPAAEGPAAELVKAASHPEPQNKLRPPDAAYRAPKPSPTRIPRPPRAERHQAEDGLRADQVWAEFLERHSEPGAIERRAELMHEVWSEVVDDLAEDEAWSETQVASVRTVLADGRDQTLDIFIALQAGELSFHDTTNELRDTNDANSDRIAAIVGVVGAERFAQAVKEVDTLGMEL